MLLFTNYKPVNPTKQN